MLASEFSALLPSISPVSTRALSLGLVEKGLEKYFLRDVIGCELLITL